MIAQRSNLEAMPAAELLFDPLRCFQFDADVFYAVAFGVTAVVLVTHTVFSRCKKVFFYAALFSAIQTSAFAVRAAASRYPQNRQLITACFVLQAFGPVIAFRSLYRLFVSWCKLISSRSLTPVILTIVRDQRADRLSAIILAVLIALGAYGASQSILSRDSTTGTTMLRAVSCIILFILVAFEFLVVASMMWLVLSAEQTRDEAHTDTFSKDARQSHSVQEERIGSKQVTKPLLVRLIIYMILLTLFIIVAEAYNVTSAFKAIFHCNKSAVYAFKALPDLLFSVGAILPYMVSSFDEEAYTRTSNTDCRNNPID